MLLLWSYLAATLIDELMKQKRFSSIYGDSINDSVLQYNLNQYEQLNLVLRADMELRQSDLNNYQVRPEQKHLDYLPLSKPILQVLRTLSTAVSKKERATYVSAREILNHFDSQDWNDLSDEQGKNLLKYFVDPKFSTSTQFRSELRLSLSELEQGVVSTKEALEMVISELRYLQSSEEPSLSFPGARSHSELDDILIPSLSWKALK